MHDTSVPFATPSFNPFRLNTRSVAFQVGAVLLGTIFLALTSRITVPMVPVPITLQTLAVPLIGAFYGWRLGTITILAWLAEAALGVPVLAGGSGGLADFAGPTAGYLYAFPIIGALTGWLVQRGWDGRNIPLCLGAMLAANLLCLLIGGAWLAAMIGMEKGIALGVMPFLLGGVIKSALGAAIIAAASQSRQERSTI